MSTKFKVLQKCSILSVLTKSFLTRLDTVPDNVKNSITIFLKVVENKNNYFQ